MTTTAIDPVTGTVMLTLDLLVPHPDNVRRRLGDLEELTKSVKGVGIIEPLLVLPAGDDGKHMVVAGHRRLAAARKAKLTEALCVVRDLTPAEVIETMLTENLQRAEITPIEEARAYARLVELGSKARDIARKVGRSEQVVKDRLDLMVLPEPVLAMVEDRMVSLAEAAKLTKWAADEDAMAWFTKAKGSVWQLEQYITKRDRDREIEAHVEKLNAQGIKRYGGVNWYPPYTLELNKACPLKLTGLTVTAHKGEPCHQVHIGVAGYGSKIERTPVCTEPKRHTTLATAKKRSDLQMDPAKYEAAKTSSSSTTQANQAEKDRKRYAAGHARWALAQIDDEAPALTGPLATMVFRAINAHHGWNKAIVATACDLLGLPPTANKAGGTDRVGNWGPFTADPINHARAAAALSLAIMASDQWHDDRYAPLIALLDETGYEPVDDTEAAMLGQAKQERAEGLAQEVADALADDGDDDVEWLAELSAQLPDGPELDAVNARLAKALGLTDETIEETTLDDVDDPAEAGE